MNLLSPGTEGRNVASVARSDGIVDINYYVDYDSYGVSPGVSDTNWTWMINLDGSGGGNDNVHGSYGIRRTVD